MLPVITGSIPMEDGKGGLLPTLQRLEPVLGSDEDEIDLPRHQALASRVEIIGDLDQIDALAKRLVQLGGVDANGGSALLGHHDGSERLGHLLITETEEKENQEGSQYQRDDQSGLSPDGNQLFAKEGEAPGQRSHAITQPTRATSSSGSTSSTTCSSAAFTNSTKTSSNGGR